jgi:phosphatidylglycerol:prolipoprotein diacylglycerol transferase
MGQTGPVTPDLWALSGAVAAAAAFSAALYEAPRAGVDREDVWGVWPWALVCGQAGSHAYFLLAVGDGSVFAWSSWSGLNAFRGTSIQGGMLGGLLGAALYARRRRISALTLLDAFAPGGALANAATRIGCFVTGCCFGRSTTLPWAVTYRQAPDGTPLGVPLHPAQLYETALDVALALLLHRRLASSAPRRPGDVIVLYVGGISAIRFVVQFLRDDDAGRLTFGMAHSQYLALALMAAAFLRLRRGPLTKGGPGAVM